MRLASIDKAVATRTRQTGPTERTEQRYRIELLGSPDAADAFIDLWDALAKQAAEENPFYEHWMLLPAWRNQQDRRVMVAMVIEAQPNGRPRAIGVLPLVRRHTLHGLPVSVLRSWRHQHCYLCTPLVAADAQEEFWTTLLDWASHSGHAVLELHDVNLGGSVMCALMDVMRHRSQSFSVDSVFSRAVMHFDGNVEAYLRAGGSSPKSAERGRKRLAGSGLLEITHLSQSDDVQAWLEAFVKLEASGWKGAEQTAIGCHEQDLEYFHEICTEAFARNRLMMINIHYNGKLIAAQINLRTGRGIFGLKTAYDESHRRDSPGMMLVVEAMRSLDAEGDVRWIDSCASAENETLKRMWKERRLIADIVCPLGHRGGHLAASMLPVARYVKRQATSLARLHTQDPH